MASHGGTTHLVMSPLEFMSPRGGKADCVGRESYLAWHACAFVHKSYAMQFLDVTLAARGQIVIPKEARDALGLKPGARLQLRVEGGRLLIEKRVQLDLSRWIGKAVPDGLSTEQALTELRGRPVPWQGDAAAAKTAAAAQRRPGRPKKAPRK